MIAHLASLSIIACFLGVVTGKDYENCTEAIGAGSFACYTCYDLNGYSCDWGLACCTGSCWKLHDSEKGSVTIAKGCTAKKQSAKSSEFDAGIEIGGKKLSGSTYFCDGEDFCNPASLALPSLLSLATALALLLH